MVDNPLRVGLGARPLGRIRAAFLAGALACLACTPGCIPVAGGDRSMPPGAAVLGLRSGPGAGHIVGHGTLSLTIRWPRIAAAGRRGQLIPDSAARIDISVKSGQTVVASDSAVRDAGALSVTRRIRVPARQGYTVEVKAYAGEPFGATQIAGGSAQDVDVVASQDTSSAITLGPLFAPTLVSVPATLEADSAMAVGGTNFQPGHLAGAKPVVTFAKLGGGTTEVPEEDITVDSDSQITVVVPSDADSGTMTIAVDGVSVSHPVTVSGPPFIRWLFFDAGFAGDSLIIAGGRFTETTTVEFTGDTDPVTATITARDSASLTVTVPAGARTGPVTVRTGAESAASDPFWVASAVSVEAALPSWAKWVSGAFRYVATGASLQFSATPAWSFAPGKSASDYGSPPPPTTYLAWTAQNNTAGSFQSTTGSPVTFNGGASAGSATVRASIAGYARGSLELVNTTGDLGTFSTTGQPTLQIARAFHASEVIGDFVYLFGGASNVGTAYSSNERAAIASTGTIGNFTTAGVPALQTARQSHTSQVVGDYVYVIGGWNGAGMASVERAQILSNGDLGPFSASGVPALNVARWGAWSAVIGDYLYVFGGAGSGPVALDSVERAQISPGGTIGAFTLADNPTLAQARWYYTGQVIGNYVYLLGGSNGVELASVERAEILGTGLLGPFSTDGCPSLTRGRQWAFSQVVGDAIYVFGPRFVGSIDRADITGSSLGTFSAATAPPQASGVGGATAAVIGDALYVFGGSQANPVSTTQRSPLQ